MEYHQQFYLTIFYLSWILYFIALFGITNFNPEYLDTLNLIIKIYVSLFLIIRFNPFTKLKINNFDRKIIFSSGIFLLSTTAITELIKSFIITKIKTTTNKAYEDLILIKNKYQQ
jgi:hypothetical protein